MLRVDELTVVHHDDTISRFTDVRYTLDRYGLRLITSAGRERRFARHDMLTTHARSRAARSREARSREAGPPRVSDGHGGQLAEIRRHERQDARAQEAQETGPESDEDRQVLAGHTRLASRTSARNRRSFAGEVASSIRWPSSSTTGIVAKN